MIWNGSGKYTFKVRVSQNNSFTQSPVLSYQFEITAPIWQRWWFISLGLLLTAAIIFLYIKNREQALRSSKKQLEEQVARRTKEIAEKNNAITSSINYAKRIQQAMLPSDTELNEAFPEHFVFYKPRDIVSGDFYWCFYRNEKAYIAAVDCTGHGVPGAMMSMIGSSFLSEISASINATQENAPHQILNELDMRIRTALKQDTLTNTGTKSRDGMDIALCIYDKATREIHFSGAKRPLFIVSDGQLTEIKGDIFPIGGEKMKKFTSFTAHSNQLKPNDMVYLCSDGYADQFGKDNTSKFMNKKFKELIVEISKLPINQQYDTLRETHMSWKGKTEQTDDVMVIGLRIS
jgi:serine phosphatase RsbU (regulator of sigma subunit)